MTKDDNSGITSKGDEAKAFPFTDSAYWDTCGLMSAAMERDAGSGDAERISFLNKMGTEEPLSSALAIFTSLVRPGGEWDYKDSLLNRAELIKLPFRYKNGTFFGTTIPEDKEYLYYYDIWGNIHFGYVGRMCGFSENDLKSGAKAQDILGSSLSQAESATDTLSIEIGFSLFNHGSISPNAITGELKFAKTFWVEGIVKHRPKDLILETVTPKRKEQEPEWYRAMIQ